MAGLLESLKNIQFQPSAGNMGLLQMGAQMLANSGPSLTPTNFGTALGQGLNGFTQGYTGFQDREQQRLIEQAKIDQMKALYNQRMSGPDPYTSIERGPNGEMYLANHRETDPTKALTPILVNGKTVRAGALDPETQGAIVQKKEQYKGVKYKDAFGREGVAPQGVLNSAFGGNQQQAPFSFQSAQEMDAFLKSPEGQRLLTEQSAAPSPYQISPSGQAMGLSLGGQVMGPSLAEQESVKVQGDLLKKAGEAKIQNEQKATQAAQVKERSAQNINEILSTKIDGKTVDELIEEATGSGIGNIADSANAFIGRTTQSAQAARQLETLSGWLVSNVPRMEGPQSNFDVENYKIMAGMIGNAKVPAEEKKAALATLKEIMLKYQAPQAQQLEPANNGGWSIRRAE